MTIDRYTVLLIIEDKQICFLCLLLSLFSFFYLRRDNVTNPKRENMAAWNKTNLKHQTSIFKTLLHSFTACEMQRKRWIMSVLSPSVHIIKAGLSPPVGTFHPRCFDMVAFRWGWGGGHQQGDPNSIPNANKTQLSFISRASTDWMTPEIKSNTTLSAD